MHKPTVTTTEILLPIWQRVLHLQSIEIDDNFFALGGDSAVALELFDQVSRTFGKELPPAMIYHAPTIAALASILEQITIPPFPPLVRMRDGTCDPPVFVTHGVGGSVMDFFQVIKHLRTTRAVYGMQAKGIDGVDAPFDRIEDMARYSLTAVKQLQPQGPYILIGYSLGGLVALEIAQELHRRGETVALLAMVDSYPHFSQLSPGQRTGLIIRKMLRYADRELRQLSLRPSSERAAESPSPTMRRFRESGYLALGHYRPAFYRGRIRFVRAAEHTDFPSNPTAVWAHYAEELLVDTVPGDHHEIMTTHSEALGELLSRYIKESLS